MAALLHELVLTSDDRHVMFLRGQIVALSGVIDLSESIVYAVSSPNPPPGLAGSPTVQGY